MKQFTITYRGKFGWAFAVVESESKAGAKRQVTDAHPGATVITIRENNPPLPTIAGMEAPSAPEWRIARWESRGGKHWADLFFRPELRLSDGRVIPSAWYQGRNCGGGLEATTAADALAEMQGRVDKGYFQPDAAKTPMRRVL